MSDTLNSDWIAVDWGTTNLRAWAMSGRTVLARAESDNGMGSLTREAFEPALLDLVGDWLKGDPTEVVACGMVGSRQGWAEVPYVATPCAALAAQPTKVKTVDPRLSVRIIPGIKQVRPADVMRGEETQIAGFLTLNPGWDGVICLPGTHTKWALVSADEVVGFQTFMTGEMFALLSTESVLRHTIVAQGWDDEAFDAALGDAISSPEKLAGRLFSLRSESLLTGLDSGIARARLSALLIGAELAAARPYWLGQQIAVIGATGLARIYVRALANQGVLATTADAEAMTLAGLHAARAT